jgi:hypothetical protein
MVDSGLAPDRGIDLRQQRGGNLDEMHAALIAGRRETGHVADHAAAESDERAIAVEAKVRNKAVNTSPRTSSVLYCSPSGRIDRFVAQPGQRGASPVEIQRRDGGITDHQHLPTGKMGAQQVGPIQQAWTDVDGIAAVAEFNVTAFS